MIRCKEFRCTNMSLEKFLVSLFNLIHVLYLTLCTLIPIHISPCINILITVTTIVCLSIREGTHVKGSGIRSENLYRWFIFLEELHITNQLFTISILYLTLLFKTKKKIR